MRKQLSMSLQDAPVEAKRGWIETPLSELADLCLGKMLDKAKNKGELKPYLRNINVRWGSFDLDDVQEMRFEPHELERYTVVAGDVVMCEGGEPGRCAVWKRSDRFYVQKALHRIRCNVALDPDFLAYQVQLLAANGDLVRRFTGSTIKHLPGRVLAAVPVQVAPLPEQHRIVAEIEKQFTRLDAAVANLERVKANLKRARASVLKAAVEGRLVPTEASLAQADGREYEPASVLLERILEERERKHEEAQKGAKWKKKYKPPVEPDTEGLPELPEGWAWMTLDGLAAVTGGITKNKKLTDGREVPYLRVANVQRGRLDLSVVKMIFAPEDKIEKLRLRPGDILLNEGGDRDKLGRGWIWEGQLEECIHQNHVFRARVYGDVLPKYVSHYANGVGQSYFMGTGKQTTNLASISLSNIKALPVAVPPLAEQVRILGEVERRLSVLDALDESVALNLVRCNRLRQSILKRAFEGKLVPQDPNDEPASELLARIQAEAETTKPKRTKKKATRMKKTTA